MNKLTSQAQISRESVKLIKALESRVKALQATSYNQSLDVKRLTDEVSGLRLDNAALRGFIHAASPNHVPSAFVGWWEEARLRD